MENIMKQVSLRNVAIAASTFACATLLSFGWSEPGAVSLSVESAQARVGRPLTPVSVAGVARRQARRGAYGAGYGAAAVGAGLAGAAVVGGAVAAANAPYYYGRQGYYGTGPYYGAGYGPGVGYGARVGYATGAGWGTGPGWGTGVGYGPGMGSYAYYDQTPAWKRMGFTCEPGTMVKLDDGLMYHCQ